jgi:hypothetical protein
MATYLNITPTKRKILSDMLSITEIDKNCYPIIINKIDETTKNVLSLLSEDHKLYYFKKELNIDEEFKNSCFKRSSRLTVIVNNNRIIITKLRTYMTKRKLERLEKEKDDMIKEMCKNIKTDCDFNERKDYNYIHVDTKFDVLSNEEIIKLIKTPLVERVDLDICYGCKNNKELNVLTKKRNCELVVFDIKYENIDIGGILDSLKSNNQDYTLQLTLLDETIHNDQFDNDDTKMDEKTPTILRNLLCEKDVYGSMIFEDRSHSRYGIDETKILFVKENDKYILLKYYYNDETCAGCQIKFETYVKDNKFDLWNELTEKEKCFIITKTLKINKNLIEKFTYESDSDIDD